MNLVKLLSVYFFFFFFFEIFYLLPRLISLPIGWLFYFSFFQTVRQNLTEYAVLPNGSPFVKSQTPLVRSVLLCGPSGVGKTLMVESVARHLNAIILDLSVDNTMVCWCSFWFSCCCSVVVGSSPRSNDMLWTRVAQTHLSLTLVVVVFLLLSSVSFFFDHQKG